MSDAAVFRRVGLATLLGACDPPLSVVSVVEDAGDTAAAFEPMEQWASEERRRTRYVWDAYAEIWKNQSQDDPTSELTFGGVVCADACGELPAVLLWGAYASYTEEAPYSAALFALRLPIADHAWPSDQRMWASAVASDDFPGEVWSHVASNADLTGDGRSDIVTSGDELYDGIQVAPGPLPPVSGTMPWAYRVYDPGGEGVGPPLLDTRDLDGDGVGDLVVVSWSQGSAAWVSVTLGPIKEDRSLAEADAAGDLGDGLPVGGVYGLELMAGPDTNGDGYDEFVVASTYVETVWLFDGPPAPELAGAARGQVIGGAVEKAPGLGSAVELMGDSDGDGRGDLAVGAYLRPFKDEGGNGAVYAYTHPVEGVVTTDEADVLLVGEDLCGGAGGDLASGDLNGDGMADLWVLEDGLPGYYGESCWSGDPGSRAFGIAGPLPARYYLSWSDVIVEEARGRIASGGDLDGNGRDDLVETDNSGWSYLYLF